MSTEIETGNCAYCNLRKLRQTFNFKFDLNTYSNITHTDKVGHIGKDTSGYKEVKL